MRVDACGQPFQTKSPRLLDDRAGGSGGVSVAATTRHNRESQIGRLGVRNAKIEPDEHAFGPACSPIERIARFGFGHKAPYNLARLLDRLVTRAVPETHRPFVAADRKQVCSIDHAKWAQDKPGGRDRRCS